MAANNNLSIKRVTVGLTADFRTLKEAVDYFNASATSNMEILLSAGHHLITDTITVNNSSYNLQIRGMGSNITFLDASTGLTGKPMFNLKTTCNINLFQADGSTLASYGTQVNENFINFDTLNGMYTEIVNIIFKNFYIGLYDTVGTWIFLFDYTMENCSAAGYRCNTANSGSYIDAEVGDMLNNAIGFDLLKSGSGSFLLNGNYAELTAGQYAIKYVGGAGNYVLDGHTLAITNNTSNSANSATTGFDFTRSDGRDADIFVSGNLGMPDQHPSAKINLAGNATSTTITTPGTYYKASFTNTSSIPCKFTIADNKITYQPAYSRSLQMAVNLSVIASSNTASVSCAIVKNGNSATLYGKMTTFCKTAGEAFNLSTCVLLQNAVATDYFEIWITSSVGNVIVQDANWLTTTL